jgi:hypothetical protein
MFVDRIFYSFTRMLYAQSLKLKDPVRADTKVTITTGEIGTLIFKNTTDVTLFDHGHSLLRRIDKKADSSSVTTISLNEKGLFT